MHFQEAKVMVVVSTVTCASNKISLFELSDISGNTTGIMLYLYSLVPGLAPDVLRWCL